jgi:MFS family permease
MTGTFFQMLAIGASLHTREELGLFAIASAFGFGFSGIIPAYSVTIRDLYPSQEASWRIPVVLMVSMLGMAFGSWFAGLLFDTFLSYRPAFALGVAFNLVNLVLIAFLVSRTFGRRRLALAAT